jgi:1-acyl-sn-glycerol-3-phosphate acyltransferase
MTSSLVFIVLLITYGRIELALVSFIPMFVTWIWILGLMSLFDIRFNIVNIIISALIFGLGDDYSLFIMDGLLQEYKTGRKNLASYKSSIILSAITIVAGLGVLIFAKHPALNSIAIISIIGILCVVLISFVMIPFLFRLLIVNRTQKKKFPWTLWSFLKSAFAFSYFAIGCILLTAAGLLLVRLWPFGKENGKKAYHFLISKFAWSLMYIMGNVRKRIINEQGEDFRKPAIIICNHQSFLDILSTVMLYPKLVLLTNDWVWNSPVFGAVVRMADYYPVSQGAEGSIERLSDRMSKGYSVIIFPEGTRSEDGKVHRFHKGAFFLAEQLKADILPVVIHGTGYTMSKNDFMLKDGTITLKILPRIAHDDVTFGEGYRERTKKIAQYFRNEYESLRKEIGQPSSYAERLRYNYLYKGPVLEWYERIKVRLEEYYQPIDELIPASGKILDVGCGYGFMSYMLHFTQPGRDITGRDYDEDKIETASHCLSKDEHIKFVHSDALSYSFEKYNAVILSDVLHYLLPGGQEELVRKSIDSLLPGGTMLIRDGNKDLEQRHRGTRLTEYFSTRIFAFNKTKSHGLSFLSANFIKDIAASMNVSCEEVDNTRFTSNVILVLRKSGGDR